MNKIRWAALGVFLVGIFGGVSNVFADSTLLTVNISHVSLELDVPSSPVVLNLNPTFSGSSFGSVDLTAIVGTNNPSGYHLSVDFSDTALAHIGEVSGTTPTINTLETLAGGYTEDAFTVNRWGHKITGNNYFPIPSSTLSPESWTSDGPVNNAGNTMTLAAKVDASTPSGAYEVTLNYTLVANIVEPETTFDDAYAAAGKSKDATSRKYKLHEMTPAICSTITTGQTGQLVDVRDGNVYNVGKLADERCWLLDNLALDVVSPTVQTNMSPDNTNATQSAITNYLEGSNSAPSSGWSTAAVSYEPELPGSSVPSVFPLYYQPRINITSKNTTSGTLVDSQDPLEIANDWKFGVYYNYCAATVGTYCYQGNVSVGIDRDKTSAIDAEYDICPAGWRMPTGGAISSTGTNTGGGEYQILYDKYNDYTNFRTALRLPLPGRFFGRATGQSKWVEVWSSTFYGGISMYALYTDMDNNTNSQSPINRYYGHSVRCIARDGNEPDPNITTFDEAYTAAEKTKDATSDKYKLSDMSTSICSAVTTGQTGQLVDIRDGTVYRVGKLADSRCWLLDNLALDLTASGASTSITSTNTNADTTSLNALFGVTVRNATADPDGNLATASVVDWVSGYSYSAPLMNKASKDMVNSSDEIEVIRASKYGIYYNYCAASAGSYCYGNGTNYGTSYDRPDTLVDTEYDICPAGWRMPTVSWDSGEYRTLWDAYPTADGVSQINRSRTALLAPFSGYYNDGSAYIQGSFGYFWSSTKYDLSSGGDSNMNTFRIRDIDAYFSSAARYIGYSVRCIAK